ncbi:signal peptidase I [Thiothrix litoralis]|nr:signal peptidase I [Thiothrix litoralis]
MQPDTLTYKRRQPWFAAFMSLILPGYGQLYNGDINKATWLFLGFSLLAIPVMVVIALYLPVSWTFPTLLLSLLTIIGLWGYSVVDAFRTARRLQDYVLKPWQRGSLYVLVLLLCNGITLPLLTDFVRDHWVESFHIPSASMQPTLLPGDILFADKRYNRPGFKQAVQRGDIAIFVYPNDRTNYYIKRIIGLPGDVVDVDGGQLTVPAGEVYVMGDNRTASKDSRNFGTVPLQDVVGKARQLWFSSDKGTIRWERLGKVVE